MNREKDCRGRFPRAVKQQPALAYSLPSSRNNNWGQTPISRRPQNKGDSQKKNGGLPSNNISNTATNRSGNTTRNSNARTPSSGALSLTLGGGRIRDLPPPPSSPPPCNTSIYNRSGSMAELGKSSSHNNEDTNTEKRDVEYISNSSPKEKDNSASKQKPEDEDQTPLTAARLEPVIAKSMSKVYGKLDTLSTDLKKVQAQQVTTNKMMGDLKQVQKDVKKLESSFKTIHQNSIENSSRHDALAEEVHTLQAQIRNGPKQNTSGDMEILKLKALSRQKNLIFEGIPELSEISEEQAKTILTTDDQVLSFLDKTLGISKPDIDSMYRLGKPREDPSSARPILVSFQRPREREAVWRARSRLNTKENSKYRIKEDLPPELRPQMAALLKVAQHARRFPRSYRNVMVKDFQVHINGKAYFHISGMCKQNS